MHVALKKCMSYEARLRVFDELEREARAGKLTVARLFGSQESCAAIRQQRKDIEIFVYENMSEIVAVASGGLPCLDKTVIRGTFEFMSNLPLSFKLRVTEKAHEILEYLMQLVIGDYPYIPTNLLTLFKEMYSITRSREFETLYIFPAFMQKLITVAPSMAIDDFLESLSKPRILRSLPKLLCHRSFVEFVMVSLSQEGTQDLVVLRVSKVLEMMIGETLLIEENPFPVPNLIELLVRRGICHGDLRVRESCLRVALLAISLLKGDDPNSDAYNSVLRVLDGATEFICQRILESCVFRREHVYACDIIESLIEAEIPLSDPIRRLLLELTDRVFANPCCCIMHHSYVSLLGSLNRHLPSEFVEFVNSASIMPRIGECVFRQDMNPSFILYPFLHQICIFIDERIRECQLEMNDHWRNVQTVFTQRFTERMTDRGYGGYCPYVHSEDFRKLNRVGWEECE